MNKSEIITQEILKIISNITKNNKSFKINENTKLIGDSSPIDSNDLVEICLAIEDLAIQDNFYFDWSSEKEGLILIVSSKMPNLLQKSIYVNVLNKNDYSYRG